MAVGWARDSAVQDQITATVEDAARRARENLPQGESLLRCAECDEEIPQARRLALPGVCLCVECQQEKERAESDGALYNRRGSKDSQLK